MQSEPDQDIGHWSIRHGKPLIFVILTLIGVGVYLAASIPVAVFPATDFPRIVVGADNGVVPIDQMFVTVTRPLEQAVNGVQGLERVQSTTSRGSAEINLFFNWNVDMFRTLQLVDAALASAQASLPPTTRLVTQRLTFAAFPVLGYSLTSPTRPQTELWELATYEMKPRLNRLNGVSTVVVQGGQEPEFEVRIDPAKLLQAQVTVPDILEALRRSNMIDSPGLIESDHSLVLSLVSGLAKTPEEIAQIAVKTTSSGLPVRIADIADVVNSVRPVYTMVTANGKPAVLLNINRQLDGNTVTVADEVHQEIADIQKTLPSDVHLEPFYDQSVIVNDSIRSVRDAILIGLALASIIMVLFLRDWGTSLVAGLVIPATVAITFIALRVMGESFDLMTLGGLAAAVGLVIDDAIVVVENIVMHRDSGQGRSESVRSALKEITKPLIGSTITPIVVFIPLISITGVTGVFFRALAVTVGVALLTSLLLALTWTPTLSHYLIRRKDGAFKKHHDDRAGFLGGVVRGYESVLRTTVAHGFLFALFVVAAISGSAYCYSLLGTDLLPSIDEGGFILDYLSPAGSSLTETNKMLLKVEEILSKTPEVENTSRRTGLQLGLAQVTEANRGDFTVKLKANRKRTVDQVISEIREKVNDELPGLDVEFPLLLSDMIGDLTSSPEPVEVKLFSQDQNVLNQWAPRVADEIKKVKGIVDVMDGIENTISGPALTFQVDSAAAARAGFSVEQVELDISALLQGEPAPTPVILKDRPYTVRVRYPEASRANVNAIRDTMLISSTGKTATLGSLAKIIESPSQNEIRRENLQRDVVVTARLEGVSLGDGMAEIQKLMAKLGLPPTIRVEYGGLYLEQQRSFRDLVLVLSLAIILVFVVLLFEFGNFAAPVSILASALLSTSGVFLALLISGKTFNIASFMGLIMVVGIVAKNGILLLDAEQRYRAAGSSAFDAMILAGERRLRPILMTALATVAGMVPLALALGAGSEMLQPLAIAVTGGVIASLLFSLIVTPAVHYFMASGKHAPVTLP
ncbi:MAG: efflux RND transporter permease subunit [Acidobacteriota bacterium]